MAANQRFSVSHDRYVIDHLNSSNNGKGYCHEGDPENDTHLRERLLWCCLAELTERLIVNAAPMEMAPDGKLYQPFCSERHSICVALYGAIEASHLNTLEVGLSLQNKFDGQLRRLQINSLTDSIFMCYEDAVRAGSLLKDRFPQVEIKVCEIDSIEEVARGTVFH